MPAEVTANTGLDALTHCVEAYVSNVDDNYADVLAKGGMEMIFDNLQTAYAEPENAQARQNMHDASCMGGYAFTNVWLGIAHSLAHQIGGRFGIPHGCANAIVLPNVVRYNSKATNKYDKLASALGKNGAEEFAQAIEELRASVNIASSIKECGVCEESWKAQVKEMAEHAMADPCTSFNPRVLTVEDMEKIFNCCFEGSKVDF